MDTIDSTQQPAPDTSTALTLRALPDHNPGSVEPTGRTPTGERVLDLMALLALISLSAAVFTLAGPGAFTAVTSVGMGLFATWCSHRPPPR
ncbi:hypothetical protein OG372_35955 [Streptomyces sp. NBC_01020]|uniref:hypothetical protein n=1 Tax=unclassified Streptomyces TaxID=2593676 RepID=UPI00324CA33E|nr:hypothetical protein OG372_35955 [Streptomyces sp. NBC_01020]